MEELNLHERQSQDKAIEILQKKKQQQEYKLVNSLIPMKGHKVWEINEKTLEVNEAENIIHKEVSWWDALKMIDNPRYKTEIQIKPNCSYISCLNPETALKRYKEGKGSSIKSNKVRSLRLW